MKSINYILLLFAAGIMFLNTNCKDEPVNPHPGFTDTLFQSQEFLDYW